ncbi:MAG: ABC transporter ATP-binding protein [Clostridium sp.]|uniref:ABC transporter ATP-binding protein n=1 Tax=Clostridium sp. TaxID=1506 RepID=UPI003051A6D4
MIHGKNLKKKYSLGEVEIVALDIDELSISKGDFIAIMGPSGSGKSTLLNILGCMDELTDGELVIGDKNVKTLSKKEISKVKREDIGHVFQSFNLLAHLTAIENVILPLIPYKNDFDLKKRGEELLTSVGLENRIKHLPSQMSGGEQQRLAISRALINSPKIIIADEPTGNLDSKFRDDIMNIFINLNKEGYTIIMATHDAEVSQKAKKVIYLRDGKITKTEVN